MAPNREGVIRLVLEVQQLRQELADVRDLLGRKQTQLAAAESRLDDILVGETENSEEANGMVAAPVMTSTGRATLSVAGGRLVAKLSTSMLARVHGAFKKDSDMVFKASTMAERLGEGADKIGLIRQAFKKLHDDGLISKKGLGEYWLAGDHPSRSTEVEGDPSGYSGEDEDFGGRAFDEELRTAKGA